MSEGRAPDEVRTTLVGVLKLLDKRPEVLAPNRAAFVALVEVMADMSPEKRVRFLSGAAEVCGVTAAMKAAMFSRGRFIRFGLPFEFEDPLPDEFVAWISSG